MKKLFYVFIVLFLAVSMVACKKDDVIEDPVDTTAPVFEGVSDTVIDVGTAFDPLDGVTARDDVDGYITSSIVVTGTYDVNTAGVYTINYAVSDAAGNEATDSMQLIVRIPPESELFITNGDFAAPLGDEWTHWAGEGGASTATIVDGVLEYDITAAGGQWYSNQFSQPKLTIPQGLGFILEFRAKADEARPLVVKLENSSYVGYFVESISLTTEWQTFQIEFFVTAPTITNGKLIFGAGTMQAYNQIVGALTTIYLDDIRFIELDNVEDTEAPEIIGAIDKTISLGEAFDPLLGVTVDDNMDIDLTVNDIVISGTVDVNTIGEYVVTYTLTDASDNETVVTRTITVVSGIAPSSWLVVNGDFSVDQAVPYPEPAVDGWGWKVNGSGLFTASISGGMAIIDVTALGTVPYGVQFYQQNRIIEQGRIYQITFDAKADIARPIQIALEETTSRRFDIIVDLTTEWETYTIVIDHILPGYTTGKFAFFMGLVGSTSVPTTIYLDNVVVETIGEVVDTTAPVLTGLGEYNVVQNFAFDPLQNVKLFDAVDKELTVDDIVVSGTVDTATVGDYVLTYTITDAADNTETYERTVHVLAAEDMLPSTLAVVNGDFSTDQSTPYAQPAMLGWGWHGAGTFTVDISGGIMTEVVTNVGTVPHGTQFYQQNLIVETEATYRVTFRAKVDLERAIRFSLESGVSLKNFEIFDVTTEWANYEIVFTIPDAGFSNAKFAFFAGLVESDSPATTFYLDDIEIELVGYLVDNDAPIMFGVEDKSIEQGLEFNPLAGVTVFDLVDKSLTPQSIVVTGTVDYMTPNYYTLTYTLTDRQGNETVATRVITVTESGGGLPSSLKIINGDFAVDQTTAAAAGTGWGWHGNGKFMVNIADGVAKISVYENWTLFYGVQFYILNREVLDGHTYQITFRAKADDARAIQLNLESGGAKFSAYFDLTNEWAEYTYEYTHTGTSLTNGKFSFFFGNVHGMTSSTNIYLDDVVVTRIEEPSADTVAPQIWGTEAIYWVQGNTFDPMNDIRVYDHVDKLLTVEDVVVTGTVDTATVGDYDLVYTLTDASGNVATYTKIVSVIAPIDALDNRAVILDGDFALESTITNLDANVGWTLKTGGTVAGAFDAPTFVDGAIRINVTGLGSHPHSIQFFQRNSFVAEAGGVYVLSFKAKADAARDIRVSFEEAKQWQVLDFEIVGLTTEWATYNVVLSNRSNGYLDVKFGLFLGLIDTENPSNSVATAIYFDDVSVTLIGYFKDDVAPMIYAADATVEQNAVFAPMTGVIYGDAQQGSTVVITSETVGLVIDTAGVYTINTTVVGSYVLTYTVTDSFGNQTIFTRNLEVTTPVIA